jgi:tetratricopeptide (TPR) repeat protein
MATRPVLRIFISSTVIDLTDSRDKVRDAVLALNNLPITMETFSALPGQPTEECTRLAREADAVISIVAHRYGYVPPKDLGGDGERSITWLEVDAAQQAGKQVFVFLADEKAPWTQPKEQDRLTTEPEEKHLEILQAVRKLKEFKNYLGSQFTRATFTNPDDLAKQVAITVSKLSPFDAVHRARIWQPLFCHALQPAQHFRGRTARLDELTRWLESPVTPDRVVSVVAAGGTGKTALVDKALHEAKLSDRAGFFVWSFYEDPHTDAFLREAYVYFTGEKDAPTGGMLERLQIALSGDLPHVLVLDGLERVQSEGGSKRRGELEDLQLKRLVRALAGGVGNARALVTSRFPLVDLESWNGAGHKAIALDDLERAVALDVLRAWNVKGDDATLTRLIEPLNIGSYYHALSVAVLGSFIGNFGRGDPARAPSFALEDAQEADPKARRLHRILDEYAKALTQSERDLLARLTLFPRGVKIEFLGWIVQAGGTVAGALIGLSDLQLANQLERLKQLGLVFRYETGAEAVYSAHPFLRDFFRTLLGTKAEGVHESVRARLAPTLEKRPKRAPSDPGILDQYEFLIEESLLAGRVQEAYELYWYGMGSYANLGRGLGENARGLRILERFCPEDNFSRVDALLSRNDQANVVNDLGLLAKAAGDLVRARAAFVHSQTLDNAASDSRNESQDELNLTELEMAAARIFGARKHSHIAAHLAHAAGDDQMEISSLAYRAATHFALGEVTGAKADFARATEIYGRQLDSNIGVWQSECQLFVGDTAGALALTQANLKISPPDSRGRDVCLCNSLLARILPPSDPAAAVNHLQEARAFAERSGEVQLQLRCFQSACELSRHLGDLPQSIAEGEAGILLADTCDFGKYSIDIRISLAEAYLAASNFQKALQTARKALDLSIEPDCQYAWGQADGLHFCGLAHLRLGETELARQRLTAALALREKLGHGRIDETRRALAELDGTHRLAKTAASGGRLNS